MIWDGAEQRAAFCASQPIAPPSPLCFDRNRANTFRFFEMMQTNFQKALRLRTPFVHETAGRMPRIHGYFDFSQLISISTSASVVFAAEYQRLSTLLGVVPPTVNLPDWNDSVFKTLFQLGFFDIVGIVPQREGPAVIEGGQVQTMRIIRSVSADDLAEIDISLQQLGAFLYPGQSLSDAVIIQFLTALAEAITNVTNHAYVADIPHPHQHIDSLWVAATADRSANSLTVVIYDQGVTIPETYPRLPRLDRVKRYLSRVIRGREQDRGWQDDGTYIRAAMRYGGSRTDKSYRGKGLPQMFETLRKLGKGTLSIYSRSGWCQRDHKGRIRSGALSAALIGTLVEWTVELDPEANAP